MASAEFVDAPEALSDARVGSYHILILLLCGAALFVDGFDTLAIGYVAPVLGKSLALARGALGPVFAIGGLGALIGTLASGPLTDRVGAKPVIIGSLFLFGLLSIATAYANSVPALTWLRFASGLGLGAVAPNGLALAAEYMPRRLRVTLVILVWFGFSLGSGFAGGITALLLTHYTWRSVFVFGGIIPLLLIPILVFALPNSLSHLLKIPSARPKIASLLARLNPAARPPADAIFVTSERKQVGFPVALLFTEGRAPITILLWLMFFANLMALFFMNSWLPTVLNNAGMSAYAAIIIGSVSHFGGIAGGLAIAPLCDKFNGYITLGVAFLLSGLSILAIGASGDAATAATAAVFCAGFFTFGAQNAANAMVSTVYPGAMRGTGTSWALGVGRTGQIVGPAIGGVLLSQHWPSNNIMYVVAIPGLVAAACALSISAMGGSAKRKAALT
ncbi:MAG TPA: MFS transporter [Beijerinckiaceae bacterium]|nr:MFS transporter [Beijerinckiaceae bacterium]